MEYHFNYVQWLNGISSSWLYAILNQTLSEDEMNNLTCLSPTVKNTILTLYC
jgi:hypothetical protein